MKRISKATFGEIHLCSTEAQIWIVWLQQILWLCANISPVKIIKTNDVLGPFQVFGDLMVPNMLISES